MGMPIGWDKKWERPAWAGIREAVEEAYEKCQGNRTRMAKELGVCLRTARKWVKELDLDKDSPYAPKRSPARSRS